MYTLATIKVFEVNLSPVYLLLHVDNHYTQQSTLSMYFFGGIEDEMNLF